MPDLNQLSRQILIILALKYHQASTNDAREAAKRNYDDKVSELADMARIVPMDKGGSAMPGFRWVSSSSATELLRIRDTSNLSKDALRERIAEVLDSELVPSLPEPAQFNEKPPEREWIVQDWIPRGEVTLFTGRGGLGKSVLALQLAVAVATGGNYPALAKGRGQKAWKVGDEKGSVIYASWEDDNYEASRRIRAIGAGKFQNGLEEKLRYHYLGACGPIWRPRIEGSMHISTMGELSLSGSELFRLAKQRKVKLIILDPLAAAYACNENDRAQVRAYMTSLANMAKEIQMAVLLISHPSKGYSYSGSTDWHSAARSVIHLANPQDAKSEKTWPKLSHIKSSYGTLQESLDLRPRGWPENKGLRAWEVGQGKKSGKFEI